MFTIVTETCTKKNHTHNVFRVVDGIVYGPLAQLLEADGYIRDPIAHLAALACTRWIASFGSAMNFVRELQDRGYRVSAFSDASGMTVLHVQASLRMEWWPWGGQVWRPG